MAIINYCGDRFAGLSTDTKPITGLHSGALFVELDTLKQWTFTSGQWFWNSSHEQNFLQKIQTINVTGTRISGHVTFTGIGQGFGVFMSGNTIVFSGTTGAGGGSFVDDGTFVRITGEQTISGVKTFAVDAYFTGSGVGVGTTGVSQVGCTGLRGIFDVYRDAVGSVPNGSVTDSAGGNFDDSNLFAFAFRVYAFKIIDSNKTYSKTPLNLSYTEADTLGSYYLNLSWTAVPGASGYKIVVDSDSYNDYQGFHYLETGATSINYGDGTEMNFIQQSPMVITPNGPDLFVSRCGNVYCHSDILTPNNFLSSGEIQVRDGGGMRTTISSPTPSVSTYAIDISGDPGAGQNIGGLRVIGGNSSDPFLEMASFDTNFTRIAYGLFGVRNGGNAFFQHTAGSFWFQIEQGGGGLGNVVAGRLAAGASSMPTARIHVNTAGTTAASSAPIKLTVGTLMTAPEAGAIEYNSTGFYVTNSSSVRQQITTGGPYYPSQTNPSGYLTLTNVGGVRTLVVTGFSLSGNVQLTGVGTVTVYTGSAGQIIFSGAAGGASAGVNTLVVTGFSLSGNVQLTGVGGLSVYTGSAAQIIFSGNFYPNTSNPSGYLTNPWGVHWLTVTGRNFSGSLNLTGAGGITVISGSATQIIVSGNFYPNTSNPSGYLTNPWGVHRVNVTGRFISGDVIITGGSNVTVTSSGQTITISAAGGTGQAASLSGARSFINFVMDGAQSTITTGTKGYVEMPFDFTLTGWTLLADRSGNLEMDIYKNDYAGHPGSAGNGIAGAFPTLANQIKNQDDDMTGWVTNFNYRDILTFYVNSVSGIQLATIVLRGYRNN